MNSDLCLKSFISYDFPNDPYEPDDPITTNYGLGNSCWIDSLFVALFHSKNHLIEEFVDKLQIKKYENIFNKKELENYENLIVLNIINIYNIINIDDYDYDVEKIKICYDFRHTLENHRKILIKNNIITDLDPDFNSFLFLNSSYELLKYLKEYVLDEKCFDSIELNEIILFHNDTLNNKFNLSYNNINFINIKYGLNPETRSSFFTDSNKIKDNLFEHLYLHSIIIHNGSHYTCYYKCWDKWYFYNDLGINNDLGIKPTKAKERTILIGSLEDVMKKHNSDLNKTNNVNNYEMTLLYLKNEETQHFQLATQQSAISRLGSQSQQEKNENSELKQAIQNSQDDDLEMEQAIIENFKQQQLKAKEDLEMQEVIQKDLELQKISQLSQVKYPKPNKIYKLKELIDEHFERLKNLIL
jgi:hypothetical protein